MDVCRNLKIHPERDLEEGAIMDWTFWLTLAVLLIFMATIKGDSIFHDK